MIILKFDTDDLTGNELAALLLLVDAVVCTEAERSGLDEDIRAAGEANCGNEFTDCIKAVKELLR